MIAYGALLLVLSLQQPVPPSSRAVHEVARLNSNAAQLVDVARHHTDTLRAAFSFALQRASLQRSAAGKTAELEAARRLAYAYARAWRDPFLYREITRFEQRNAARQRGRLHADSLRKAGIAAFTSSGVPAAMRLWRASLQHATQARDTVAQAAALGNLGAGYYRSGDLATAETHLTRSRNMASAMGDVRATAVAVGILASVYKDRGDLMNAVDMYTQASALRRRSGDSRGAAADQNNLGLVSRDLGDLIAATAAFQAALTANRAAGRPGPAATNLINLAGVASLRGDYPQADRWYSEALALQKASGDAAETAFTLHERGLLRVRRGDYAAARADLRAAMLTHERAGAELDAATVRMDIATVLMAVGEPQQAMTMLKEAETAARRADASDALLGDFALARGDMAVELNAFEDAAEEYTSAERYYRAADDDYGLGKVAEGRGLLLHVRGNYAGAAVALTGAMRAYLRADDARAAALAQLSLAYAQMQLGDTAAALRSIKQASATLSRVGDVVGETAALQAQGDVAMARRTPVLAETFYRAGLVKLGDRPAVNLRWRLHAGRASALRAQNALPAAVQQLQAAIEEIERSSSALIAPERKASFLADKLDVYGDLMLAERAQGDVAEAFEVSERMRAQQMLGLLSQARVVTTRASVTEEQDLRRQIGDLTTALDEPFDEQSDTRESSHGKRSNAAAREALYQAQRKYARLLTEVREQEPGYAAVVSPVNASVAAIARRLRRDEAMIDYVITDSTTLAFVITDRGASLIDLNIAKRILAPRIAFAVRVTQRVDTPARGELWKAPLSRLYDDLVAPLEESGALDGKRTLIIVPHAELHFVPFAALMNRANGRFMVSRWDISYAPSASVWLRLRENSHKRGSKVLALAPRQDALPFSIAEVNGIKRIYGRSATVLTGGAASKQALRAALPSVGVVHFATLGVLNKHSPLFSFVDLGSRAGQRDRLEVHEAFGLDLRGQLIVLSACQTGLASGALADVPPGDDWMGLVQAFLTAGAGAVVASLWSVEDRATAELMTRFHRSLEAGRGDVKALADAQRATLATPRTAHPFYWAAFTVNGPGARE